MDIDLNWILLGLPIAFALGWLASRLDFRQLRIQNRQAPKAYFRGLNFLLNEQQDKAIDAFIEAVQNDPDTSELHFALGNLFRRRGEYERAVRVHEHLLSRGDLDQHDRERAQHALALDFLKAGLLDRAEEALHRLNGTSFQTEAQLAMLSIYERARDWPQAAATASGLASSSQGDFSGRQAHYLCEQAKGLPPEQALLLLQRASAIAPALARPRMELAEIEAGRGDEQAAFQTLMVLAEKTPATLPLVALRLAQVARACGREPEAIAVLDHSYQQSHSLDLLDALRDLEPDPASARDRCLRHLEKEASLSAAARMLKGEKLPNEGLQKLLQASLERAAKPLQRYRCAACGFEASQYFWQCPGCQTWDSFPPRRIEEL